MSAHARGFVRKRASRRRAEALQRDPHRRDLRIPRQPQHRLVIDGVHLEARSPLDPMLFQLHIPDEGQMGASKHALL